MEKDCEKIRVNGPGKRKSEKQFVWQRVKHAKLYFDLLLGLKSKKCTFDSSGYSAQGDLNFCIHAAKGWGCSSVGRASDRQVSHSGSTPVCAHTKVTLSMSGFGGLWKNDLTLCSVNPKKNVLLKSKHRKLNSVTPSQLAFTRESNPNFSWKKS